MNMKRARLHMRAMIGRDVRIVWNRQRQKMSG